MYVALKTEDDDIQVAQGRYLKSPINIIAVSGLRRWRVTPGTSREGTCQTAAAQGLYRHFSLVIRKKTNPTFGHLFLYMCRTPKLCEHRNSDTEKTDAPMNMPKGTGASLFTEGTSSPAHLRQGRTPGFRIYSLK